MQTARRGFVVWLLVACAIGCPISGPNAHYRPPGHGDVSFSISGDGTELVFNASGQGGRDVYLMRLADYRVTRVAATNAYEVDPSLSPDGSRIVYAAGVPGDRADHLFMINRDGSGKKQLTHASGNDMQPRFSPDGRTVVFVRDKTYNWGGLAANWSNAGVVIVLSLADGVERQLTADDQHAWSPEFTSDGKRIRFQLQDSVCEIAVDGGPIERIGPDRSSACFFDEGRQVVFSDGTYESDCELYVASTSATKRVAITANRFGEFKPEVTPDENTVYYLRIVWPKGPTGEPKSSLWRVGLDGTAETRVADYGLFDTPLQWRSPVAVE